MELSLGISIVMTLAIFFGCLWMLKELRECRKIINKMQKRSRKYIREVVSND
jgi:hypothetical protein|tara:strand:- start:342 stop:497 length:156 start_codon:yes stop_codon:yes gene_type:complete